MGGRGLAGTTLALLGTATMDFKLSTSPAPKFSKPRITVLRSGGRGYRGYNRRPKCNQVVSSFRLQHSNPRQPTSGGCPKYSRRKKWTRSETAMGDRVRSTYPVLSSRYRRHYGLQSLPAFRRSSRLSSERDGRVWQTNGLSRDVLLSHRARLQCL